MPVVGLFGPHAVGKTTAVKRWVDHYKPRILGVLADNQQTYDGQTLQKSAGWQGTFDQKAACLAIVRKEPRVVVIESCSSYGTQIARSFQPEDYIIHVCCSPDVLRQNLAHRSGAKFNAAYWDSKRCLYEAQRRFDNCVARYLNPAQCRRFVVDSYEAGWEEVDEYFGQLYRRLHNAIVRSRR